MKYVIKGDAYKAWTCSFPIGSHQDIVDSFLKGSRCYPGVEIRVNPSRKEAEGTYVYVPSGWRALRDAVKMKREGRIKGLIGAPIGEHVGEYDRLLLDSAIDVCVVPCDWWKVKSEREAESLGLRFNKIVSWPVGVDHERWQPLDSSRPSCFQKALVYVKRRPEMETPTLRVLADKGIEARVIHYKKHVQEEFKELLEWCDFVVYLVDTETQGLALAQAWSMNRQTLVYESEDVARLGQDAAPYLTPDTGAKWRNESQLRELLDDMRMRPARRWIQENQTNEIRFGAFLDILKDLPQ